jgi:hypothetical protein
MPPAWLELRGLSQEGCGSSITVRALTRSEADSGPSSNHDEGVNLNVDGGRLLTVDQYKKPFLRG